MTATSQAREAHTVLGIEPLDTGGEPEPIRVLLVRNAGANDVIRRELTERVSRLEVRAADTLYGAVTLLESAHFDCLVVDLDLPDAPASMARDVLLSHPSDTPVLVLDRGDDIGVASDLIRRGAQDVLSTVHADVRSIERAVVCAQARHRYQLHVRQVRSRLDAIVQEVTDRHRLTNLAQA